MPKYGTEGPKKSELTAFFGFRLLNFQNTFDIFSFFPSESRSKFGEALNRIQA